MGYFTGVGYRLFRKAMPHLAFFKHAYYRSGISRLYESYLVAMCLATLLAFGLVFVIGALIHSFFFELTPIRYLLAITTFSSTISLFVPIAFIAYPLVRSIQRGREVDANLVYTTGYMAILAAGDLTIERIFERVAEVEPHDAVRELAGRLLTDVRMFGSDVASSLNNIALRSPSQYFSKLLAAIINTARTSGDLKSLLKFETERLLHAKREQLKKTLNNLAVLGEIYITSLVMAPILFIVMLTILSVMGNVAFGLSPALQLNLLIFFGLPVMGTVFLLILNSVLPEEE